MFHGPFGNPGCPICLEGESVFPTKSRCEWLSPSGLQDPYTTVVPFPLLPIWLPFREVLENFIEFPLLGMPGTYYIVSMTDLAFQRASPLALWRGNYCSMAPSGIQVARFAWKMNPFFLQNRGGNGPAKGYKHKSNGYKRSSVQSEMTVLLQNGIEITGYKRLSVRSGMDPKSMIRHVPPRSQARGIHTCSVHGVLRM